MKVKVLILAGGLGTRLKTVVSDVPKSLALINGIPFIFYLLDYLISQEFTTEVIISVGHGAEMIKESVGSKYKDIKIVYCQEQLPLGTGGAVKYCLSGHEDFDHFLILNGDTLAKVPFRDFLQFHLTRNSDITLASKLLYNFDRYGSISIQKNGVVSRFNEKKLTKEGYINCGVYLVSKNFYKSTLLSISQESFSFEKEVLEKHSSISAFISDFYFIDIGIPDDYAKAQKEFF
jgi:D-glycero-alpha-D-manno-heptose 1-phosphate guanylyltransferase